MRKGSGKPESPQSCCCLPSSPSLEMPAEISLNALLLSTRESNLILASHRAHHLHIRIFISPFLVRYAFVMEEYWRISTHIDDKVLRFFILSFVGRLVGFPLFLSGFNFFRQSRYSHGPFSGLTRQQPIQIRWGQYSHPSRARLFSLSHTSGDSGTFLL